MGLMEDVGCASVSIVENQASVLSPDENLVLGSENAGRSDACERDVPKLMPRLVTGPKLTPSSWLQDEESFVAHGQGVGINPREFVLKRSLAP